MDLQALKLAFSYAPPRMCLKLCGISGDCRSRPVNMGDEPVNELNNFRNVKIRHSICCSSTIPNVKQLMCEHN